MPEKSGIKIQIVYSLRSTIIVRRRILFRDFSVFHTVIGHTVFDKITIANYYCNQSYFDVLKTGWTCYTFTTVTYCSQQV